MLQPSVTHHAHRHEQDIAEQEHDEQRDADHAEKKERVFLNGVKKLMERGGLELVLAQLDDLDDPTATMLLGWAACRETPRGMRAWLA